MIRVLLVEDSDVNRAMLARRLEQRGYKVTPAESGERALALARSQPFDVVLMDLRLPDIDGWEATRQLKANPRTATLPVVALSAHALAADREKALASGCIEFQPKPIDLPQLLASIERVATRPTAPIAPPVEAEDDDDCIFSNLPESNDSGGKTAILSRANAAAAAPVVLPFEKLILIVEDTDVNRVMLRRRLEKQGHRVMEAPDGQTALSLARLHRFDLILLDIMMPGMDGYEVLGELKGDAELAVVPVIMISAIDDSASVARCIEAGAEDYLPKPYDPVLLQARLTVCLDKRRRRDDESAYLKAVLTLSRAAMAVESGNFDPETLKVVANREDELGRLASLFRRMAVEVVQRESNLRQEVHRLKVEIDQSQKSRQVAEVTETKYFQDLEQKAQELRQRNRRNSDGTA
jgi:two-component system cell cycle response regulator